MKQRNFELEKAAKGSKKDSKEHFFLDRILHCTKDTERPTLKTELPRPLNNIFPLKKRRTNNETLEQLASEKTIPKPHELHHIPIPHRKKKSSEKIHPGKEIFNS